MTKKINELENKSEKPLKERIANLRHINQELEEINKVLEKILDREIQNANIRDIT